MQRLQVPGGELEFESAGSGEPLVLIHGSIIAEGYAPLLREEGLTDRYRVTHYHRRGFLGSSRHQGPWSIAQQAQDAAAVIREVAGGRAHVAGHSYGGVIALQLALSEPGAVASLSLFEPPMSVPSAEAFFANLPPVAAKYEAGDRAGAVDAFLTLVLGEGYRVAADANLPPGWFDDAAADIDAFFQVEVPALNEWQLTAADVERIRQPILSVVGSDSVLFFQEGHALVQQLFPRAEALVVQGATHGLQMQQPRTVAAGLAAFLARHSMLAGVS